MKKQKRGILRKEEKKKGLTYN